MKALMVCSINTGHKWLGVVKKNPTPADKLCPNCRRWVQGKASQPDHKIAAFVQRNRLQGQRIALLNDGGRLSYILYIRGQRRIRAQHLRTKLKRRRASMPLRPASEQRLNS
jgi:hypothetical protein